MSNVYRSDLECINFYKKGEIVLRVIKDKSGIIFSTDTDNYSIENISLEEFVCYYLSDNSEISVGSDNKYIRIRKDNEDLPIKIYYVEEDRDNLDLKLLATPDSLDFNLNYTRKKQNDFTVIDLITNDGNHIKGIGEYDLRNNICRTSFCDGGNLTIRLNVHPIDIYLLAKRASEEFAQDKDCSEILVETYISIYRVAITVVDNDYRMSFFVNEEPFVTFNFKDFKLYLD